MQKGLKMDDLISRKRSLSKTIKGARSTVAGKANYDRHNSDDDDNSD